jgi:hypothetical protein
VVNNLIKPVLFPSTPLPSPIICMEFLTFYLFFIFKDVFNQNVYSHPSHSEFLV